MVARLQTKASQIGNILQSLEKKYESQMDHQHTGGGRSSTDSAAAVCKSPGTRRQQNLQKFEAFSKKHKFDVGPPMKRQHLKIDAFPPFNPNDYRKSPSAASASTAISAVAAAAATLATNADSIMEASCEELKTPTTAKSLNAVESCFEPRPVVDSSQSDYVIVEKEN